MVSRIFVFPGQGSQTVGMGKELADAFPEARHVFEEVDDALGQALSRIIFDGPEETLTLTENAQPAIMATSMAFLRVLEKQAGIEWGKQVAMVAGHSLGEYTALAAAGAFSLADTARLLKIRGQAMQAAVPAGKGGMAAILGLDFVEVDEIAEAASAGEERCAVANDNSPGQVVISGHTEAVNRAMELAKAKGAKRALPLAVSAPFHCDLMQPAADAMRDALQKIAPKAPLVPVLANVTATPSQDASHIVSLLVQQVTGMVRWRESMEQLQSLGITHHVEIGAGKVLTGLIRRIDKEIEAIAVSTPAEIEAFAKTL
jgi:[acyl-carrier-protein] S-malonyltransferase